MSELTKEKCEACRPDAPKVDGSQREALAAQVPEWESVMVDGVERLRRVFELKDYQQSVAFTNEIASMAEEEDHHPMILLEWGKVTVEWWTHKIHGLHRNDFISAAKTDTIWAQRA